MTRRLKVGESFLRFLVDSLTSKKQARCVLVEASRKHLDILGEVFYNLLKNQDSLSPSLKRIVIKRKKLLRTFVELSTSKHAQKKFLYRHFYILYKLLAASKKVIFQFF